MRLTITLQNLVVARQWERLRMPGLVSQACSFLQLGMVAVVARVKGTLELQIWQAAYDKQIIVLKAHV